MIKLTMYLYVRVKISETTCLVAGVEVRNLRMFS